MSFVLLDKPKNLTSFDACTIAKRDLGFKKAGHSGTLDPLATGLLPVFFDKSTKFIQFLMNKDKTYEAEFLFGCSSDTLDITGNLTKYTDEKVPDKHEIQNALEEIKNLKELLVPSFSAKKVAGTPMYRLARRGVNFRRVKQSIEIFEIKLLNFSYPKFKVRLRSSKGTYVRSVGEELSNRLKVSLVLNNLRRKKIGGFNLDRSIGLDELKNLDKKQKMQYVKPVEEILSDFPKVNIGSTEVKKFQNGMTINIKLSTDLGLHKVFKNNTFIGLGEVLDKQILKPKKLYFEGEIQ